MTWIRGLFAHGSADYLHMDPRIIRTCTQVLDSYFLLNRLDIIQYITGLDCPPIHGYVASINII